MTAEKRSLAVPISSMPGEGLKELIVRATAENSYGSCSKIPNAVGIRGGLPSGLSRKAINQAEALAALLGLPGGADDLAPLLIEIEGDDHVWLSFFGTRIRKRYRDASARRVSPRSLARSPYLKAIWSVRVVGFDPQTKETLLDRCPVCQKRLGWTRTRGVAYCDRCLVIDSNGFERPTVDLRDHPQPLVDEDYWKELDFLTCLIDPETCVRECITNELSAAMRGFDRGDLFEFAIAMACAFSSPQERTGQCIPRQAGKEKYERLSPGVLAKAARAVLDWPATFNSVLDEARDAASLRPGLFGVYKAFGAIALLRTDPYLHIGLREVVSAEIDRHLASSRSLLPSGTWQLRQGDSDLVPTWKAIETLGISQARFKRMLTRARIAAIPTQGAQNGPKLVSLRQISSARAAADNLISFDAAAARLGTPSLSVHTLCQLGILEFGSEHGGVLAAAETTRTSVDSLVRRLENISHRQNPPPCSAVLSSAVTRLGSPHSDPWPGLFQAILAGKLQVWRSKRDGPFSSTVSICLSEAIALNLNPEPWANASRDSVPSHVDSARLLGTNDVTLYALFGTGLLPRQPSLKRLCTFARRYVLTSELTNILQSRGVGLHHRLTALLVQDRGVVPIRSPDGFHRFVWSRQEAEQAIDHICQDWQRCSRELPTRGSRPKFCDLIVTPRSSLDAAEVATSLGVPRLAVRGLGLIGLLSVKPTEGSEVTVEPRSLDVLLTTISRVVELGAILTPMPLALAAAIAGSPHMNPWPLILRGIAMGQIPAALARTGGVPYATASGPWVHEIEALEWTADDHNARIVQADMALLLGTDRVAVRGLIRDGLLSRSARLPELQKFANEFVLTSEIAHRFTLRGRTMQPGVAAENLRLNELRPAARLSYKNYLVWNRQEVDRLLSDDRALSQTGCYEP